MNILLRSPLERAKAELEELARLQFEEQKALQRASATLAYCDARTKYLRDFIAAAAPKPAAVVELSK